MPLQPGSEILLLCYCRSTSKWVRPLVQQLVLELVVITIKFVCLLFLNESLHFLTKEEGFITVLKQCMFLSFFSCSLHVGRMFLNSLKQVFFQFKLSLPSCQQVWLTLVFGYVK